MRITYNFERTAYGMLSTMEKLNLINTVDVDNYYIRHTHTYFPMKWCYIYDK